MTTTTTTTTTEGLVAPQLVLSPSKKKNGSASDANDEAMAGNETSPTPRPDATMTKVAEYLSTKAKKEHFDLTGKNPQGNPNSSYC